MADVSTITTVNDALLDRAVSHQIGLQRLYSGITDRLSATLNKYDLALANEIQKRELASGNLSQARIDTLLNAIHKVNNQAYDAVQKQLTNELWSLAKYEQDFQIKALGKELPFDWDFSKTSTRMLGDVLKNAPIQGATIEEWVAGMADGRFQRMRNAIRIGVTEGQSADEVIDALLGTKEANFRDGVLNTSRRSLESVTKTLANGATSIAKSEVAGNNDDLIDAEQWVSVLDDSTTDICESRDGNVYPIGQGPRPPAHIGCRSNTVFVVKSAADLDVNISDELRPRLTGKPAIPLKYPAWIRKQSPEFQDSILGPERGKLFREGKLSVRRFKDHVGTRYSFKQLEQIDFPKEGVAMPASKLVNVRRRNFGWKPDLPDLRDHLFAAKHPDQIDVPQKVSLRDKMPAVFNQGGLGSCTANALVAAVMFTLGPKTPMLSRLDLYYSERKIENSIKEDAGAEIRDGIKALAKRGVCLESTWPYKISKFKQTPPADTNDEAAHYKITSYSRLKTHDDFTKCLASGFPFVGGFTVYENFDGDELEKKGILTIPTVTQKMVGGHAVCFVGYDMDFHSNPVFKKSGLSTNEVPSLMYEVRNSFGSEWGDDGYFWMPAPYVESRDLSDDFWTIRKAG